MEALAEFVKGIGLPATLQELNVNERLDLGAVAASCNMAPGSCREMSHAEIAQISREAFEQKC